MSVWKGIFKKRFVVTIILTVAAALGVTAVGALVIAAGLWSIDRAWIWICLSWGIAGFICSQHVAAEESGRLFQSVAAVGIAMLIMLLAGCLDAEQGSGNAVRWGWYVMSGLLGAAVASAAPGSDKRRKRRKKVAYKQQKRATALRT